MSSNNKVMRKVVPVFLAAILLMSMQMRLPALAMEDETRYVPRGETVRIDLTFDEAEAYAGMEFGLTLSSESALKVDSFVLGDAVNGATVIPVTQAKGTYYFGFFAATNKFEGKINVGTIYLTYTGNTAQTVVLSYMQVGRIENGHPVGTAKSEPIATITLRRASSEVESDVEDTDPNDGLGVDVEIEDGKGSQYFDDVDESWDWAAKEIDYLYEAGVVEGTGYRMYTPAGDIRRGDFVLMLVRAYELKGEFEENFSDVPADSYYYDAIGIAKTLGVALGIGENKFAPDAPMTRQEMMAFVERAFRALGKPFPPGDETDLAAFADQDMISDFARVPAATLVKAGIIKGTDLDMIQPLRYTSRAEIAIVVYRLITMEEQ